MTNYGIKVGDNASSDADKDLKFTTKYGSLKIFATGTTSLTTDGSGDATATVAHNLGYAPAYLVFRKCNSTWTFMDASTHNNAYVPVGTPNYWGNINDFHHALHAYTDDTNIYIKADGAKASTTYDFRYYLLVDQAEDFSGDFGGSLSTNYGFKVSKEGIDVTTAKEYELGYSSKYKSLQYYDVNYKTQDLTLDAIWSSKYDTYEEQGEYVDINHGLGYPPLFLAFFTSDQFSGSYQLPIFSVTGFADTFTYMVSSFSDATKIRISFWRSVLTNPVTDVGQSYPQETINIKCYIFTEDMTI